MRDEIFRLKQELEKGKNEEVRKEFWKIVGKVKRGMNVSEEDIEELCRIRDRVFDKRIVLSTKKGSILFPIGFVISFAMFLWINFSNFNYLLLIISEIFVIYFGFLTGRLLGGFVSKIAFDGFYLYTPLEFGVKINFKDYLKKRQKDRVMLYGTTLCFQAFTMIALLILVCLSNPQATYIPLSFLFIWFFGSMAIHYIAKTGELHRFLRELKIAMERH